MVQLSDAVDALEGWERGAALIVQGAGGNFCAGADLSLVREHVVTGEDGRFMCALMTDSLERLRRYLYPSSIDNWVAGGREICFL